MIVHYTNPKTAELIVEFDCPQIHSASVFTKRYLKKGQLVHICRYDKELAAALGAAKVVRTVDEARQVAGDAVVFYDSQEHYETLTERSGMLREWKVCLGFCATSCHAAHTSPSLLSRMCIAGDLPDCLQQSSGWETYAGRFYG